MLSAHKTDKHQYTHAQAPEMLTENPRRNSRKTLCCNIKSVGPNSTWKGKVLTFTHTVDTCLSLNSVLGP